MCSLAAQGKWSKNLKSKAKFIYLISPNKIYQNFYEDLKSFENKKSKIFSIKIKKNSKKNYPYFKKNKKICKILM